MINEKKLTPAELKKREEVAKAMEKDSPNMPMGKKMAIATAVAKRVAESHLKKGDKVKDEDGKEMEVVKSMEDDKYLVKESSGDYTVQVKHHSASGITTHSYSIKNALSAKHAKRIAMIRHEKKVGAPKNGEYFEAGSFDVKKVDESINENVIHRVSVTVSEPDHPAVSKRKDTQMRTLRISGASKEEAVKKAKAHYKSKGYRVHDAEHIEELKPNK